MSSGLDLSVPEPPRKRRIGILSVLTFLGVMGCLALLVLPPKVDRARLEALQRLGEDLERRTLYEQAAEVWREYRGLANLDRASDARILYRLGRCLKEAGRYAEAARYLTAVEGTTLDDEKEQNARVLLLECLSALGKEEAREQLLEAFSIPGTEEKGTVVARIGADEITLEDLRQEVTRDVLTQLRLLEETADPAEIDKRKDEIVDRVLKDPNAVRSALQNLISTEVLYRQALADKVLDDAARRALEQAVARFRRNYVAQELVSAEIKNALSGVGSEDLRDHYEAHKDRYVEKPAVEFSFLELDSKSAAEEALEALSEGGEREREVAERFQAGAGPAVQGEPIPGLGQSAEANAHLLALEEGKTGERPIQIGSSWYVFRADKERPLREKSFEEAQAEVRADLLRRKREEAMRKLEDRLMGKFRVEVYEEALPSPDAAETKDTGAESAKEGVKDEAQKESREAR